MINAGYLIYKEKGKLIKVDVPKDFCCILTLNSRKEKFSGTRQELPESFKKNLYPLNFQKWKENSYMK